MERALGAVKLKVASLELFERDVRLRMPFRFGVVTLTESPQAFVRARIRTEDGREAAGAAAELLAPKSFDKNPALSNEDNYEQLRASLRSARERYLAHGMQTPWRHSSPRTSRSACCARGTRIAATSSRSGIDSGCGQSPITRPSCS